MGAGRLLCHFQGKQYIVWYTPEVAGDDYRIKPLGRFEGRVGNRLGAVGGLPNIPAYP